MGQNEIRKGDIGVTLQLTIQDQDGTAVDVSGATTKQVKIFKPDGTVLEKTAVFVTDGINGKIKYTTVSGDLSEIGAWGFQGYIVLSTGTWHTDKHTFNVWDNYEA